MAGLRQTHWGKSPLLVALTCVTVCLGGRASLAQPQEAAIDLPTVAAVQGDNDRAIDWASEFLTGCKYVCELPNTPESCSCKHTVYHAPSSWYRSHLHLDGTIDYTVFYEDKRVKGRDEASTHGLEHSRVLFYAGEGVVDSFNASDRRDVYLKRFSLGDGNVRYLFMLSCNVFAHGPRTATGDFLNPGMFSSSQFQARPTETADAFVRWGAKDGTTGVTPLNPRLRLACGGSSQIGGAPEYGNYPTHLFWYYSSVRRLNPADSWLLGLYVHDRAEPLCMSRGESLQNSGLRDPWFQREPLVQGAALPNFVYIEYPVEGRPDDPLLQAASKGVPARPTAPPQPLAEAASLPVLKVTATSVPPIFNEEASAGPALGYGFRGGAANLVAPGLLPALFPPSPVPPGAAIQAEDVCVEKNPASGSVAISWRPNAIVDNPNTVRDLDVAANDFLLRLIDLFKDADKQVPSDKEQKTSVQVVTAIQMKVDAVEAAALQTQPNSQDGCLYLRQTRSVDIGQPKPVPIFGEGSETLIGRCPAVAIRLEPSAAPQTRTNPCARAGSPLATFVYTNRGIMKVDVDQAKVAKLRPKDAVIQEARSMLGLPIDQADRYTSVSLRLGYRAGPVHCVQGQMYLVYQVDFTADDPHLPPRTVELPAQDLGEARTMENAWECSPE